jgi:hypothetical protein
MRVIGARLDGVGRFSDADCTARESNSGPRKRAGGEHRPRKNKEP